MPGFFYWPKESPGAAGADRVTLRMSAESITYRNAGIVPSTP